MDRKRSKKKDVIQYALEQMGLQICAYHHDWSTGARCLALKRKSLILSVSFMALVQEELEEAGATYIVQEVGEIAKIINTKKLKLG